MVLFSNSDPNNVPFIKLFKLDNDDLFGGVDGDDEDAEVAEEAASLLPVPELLQLLLRDIGGEV